MRPGTQRVGAAAVVDGAEPVPRDEEVEPEPWPPQPAATTARAAIPAVGVRRMALRDAVQRPGGHLAPELLEAIEVARLGREDVHDGVEVVHEDPAGLADALDAPWKQAVLLLHPEVHAVVDRLGLALGVARADHEVVGVAEHASQIEFDDVDRLLLLGEPRDGAGQLGAGHEEATADRYSPRASMYSATASGTR